MFFCPYCMSDFRERIPQAHVRILHASPDTPAVDVYANGRLLVKRLRFKEFTEYLSIPPGKYNIRVYPTGSTQKPVLSTNFEILDGKIYTIAAIGKFPDVSLMAIADPRRMIPRSKVLIRFSHLSPDAPAVDVGLKNGTNLFSNIQYKQTTQYIEAEPGLYNFVIKLAGTDKQVLLVPNIHLRPNRMYTIYAVGLASGNPSLQALIALDGGTYIKL